jgi:hypothetical protein
LAFGFTIVVVVVAVVVVVELRGWYCSRSLINIRPTDCCCLQICNHTNNNTNPIIKMRTPPLYDNPLVRVGFLLFLMIFFISDLSMQHVDDEFVYYDDGF